MSSANCSDLDQSKILSSGNGLKITHVSYTTKLPLPTRVDQYYTAQNFHADPGRID